MNRTLDWRNTYACALAVSFADVLREHLTPDEFAEAQLRNSCELAGQTTDAMHDHCDANMAMDEAFQALMGRELNLGDDVPGAAESDSGIGPDGDLFNAAWAIARRCYLEEGCAAPSRPDRQLSEFMARGFNPPPLPYGFENISWRNDAAPSYALGDLSLYMDHPDDAEREFPGGLPRFSVSDHSGLSRDGFQSEDFGACVSYMLARAYAGFA